MASINISSIVDEMMAAFKASIKCAWPTVEHYAEVELNKLAHAVISVKKMQLAGTISQQQAKLYFDMQKNTAETVMLTATGLTEIAIQNAVNAALTAVKTTINTALGWSLV